MLVVKMTDNMCVLDYTGFVHAKKLSKNLQIFYFGFIYILNSTVVPRLELRSKNIIEHGKTAAAR